MPGIPVMTSSVLRVEVITFSLNCRLTEVTLETVELAAGVEPTSLVCALAAVDMRSSAKAAAAEGRKDLNIKTSKWLSVLSIRRMRSEEHTSELQSLMRISYAVFCLKKKKKIKQTNQNNNHKTDECTNT